MFITGEPNFPVVINEGGEVELALERHAKLDRELEEIDNCVQHVLNVIIDGHYPATAPDTSKVRNPHTA
ncbi:MAG: hypothetical protein DHS20C18_31880 [Saprospiraceae bacterium]|nr:MAG: hypothetical protein DHS20C18_31880 [Saprospiraceae bacterium]